MELQRKGKRAMRYPTIRYVEVEPRYHLLHSYDGTCRGVVFESDEAAAAALAPGRADMDCVAIGSGLLPRGAILVSRAGSGDIDAIMAETRDVSVEEDPLAETRLRFSIKLLVERSEWISLEEDASARMADPDAADRYEKILDELERSRRQQ